jgi:predicted phage terminase large subunit-like protein
MSWSALGRNGLVQYAIAMQPDYDPGLHHYVLADALEKVYRGEITRLMVFMPPQHGKSQLATGHFIPWAIGKSKGAMRIAFATYNQTYSADWGFKINEAVTTSTAYKTMFPDVQINPHGSCGKEKMDFTSRGWFIATSVGGSLTGKGPHVIVIDDPVKDYEEGASETIQKKIQDWFSTVVRTRLPKSIILIMTRWHENDLAGWLLQESKTGGERWHVVNFPALCETKQDAIGRRQGEALWPEKIDANGLLAIKAAIPAQHWNSLFQQRPSALEGGIFLRDWWKRYFIAPREMVKNMESVCQTWDLKFKDKKTNSKVAGLVLGKQAANFYLFDIFNDHVGFPGSLDAIRDWRGRWPEAAAIYVEDKANGPAVVQTLVDEIPGVIACGKDISKEAAWHGVSPYVRSGNVYLPQAEHVPKVAEFIDQLATVPNSVFKDMADAFAQGIYELKDGGTTGIIEYYRQLITAKGKAA